MSADLKLTKDSVFKIIFGSQSNLEVLKSLIESVVGREIEQVEILNPYVDVNTIINKKTILDIKARALFQGSRETYNVEIQVKNQDYFHNRSLYYWAQSYGTQLAESETYDKLRKHICINLLNFKLFDHKKLLSKYVLLEEEEKTLLTDHLELFFVQMPHLEYNKDVLPEKGTLLDKWVYFLLYGDQLSDQEASKMHPTIAHAHRDFGNLQQNRELVDAIMREKDDLALIIQGKKLSHVEQIEDVAKDAGLILPAEVRDDLIKKDVDRLKGFVRHLYSKDRWDRDELRVEIKGFLD